VTAGDDLPADVVVALMQRFPSLGPQHFVLPPEQGGITWDQLEELLEALERCPVPLVGIWTRPE
jgi:hypothetical protein